MSVSQRQVLACVVPDKDPAGISGLQWQDPDT